MWPIPVAVAADSEPEDPAPADEVAEEIVVEGAALRRAKEQVVGALASLGYDWKVRERGDRTIYRAQANWKGKVVVTDEGVMRIRRTGPRFTEKTAIVPLCVVQPSACVKWGAWTVSDRRWNGITQDVAAATDPGLVAWGDAVADRALADRMTALPAQLDALWAEGVPLVSPGPLPSPADRRRELLAYWDSRTETEWGLEIRALVEGFVREVVESGPEPFTAEERAAFEAVRRSAEPFPFEAPP